MNPSFKKKQKKIQRIKKQEKHFLISCLWELWASSYPWSNPQLIGSNSKSFYGSNNLTLICQFNLRFFRFNLYHDWVDHVYIVQMFNINGHLVCVKELVLCSFNYLSSRGWQFFFFFKWSLKECFKRTMVINKENFHLSLFLLSFFPTQKSYIFEKSRFAYYTSCSWIYENAYQSQK